MALSRVQLLVLPAVNRLPSHRVVVYRLIPQFVDNLS
jgi:hypothetical protein